MFILPLKASNPSYLNKDLISPLTPQKKLDGQIAKPWQPQSESILKNWGSSVWLQQPFDTLRKQVHKINAWASSTWQVVTQQIPNEQRPLIRNFTLGTTFTGLAILAKYLNSSNILPVIEDTSHSQVFKAETPSLTAVFNTTPISSTPANNPIPLFKAFKAIAASPIAVFNAAPLFKAITASPTAVFKATPIPSTPANNPTPQLENPPLGWDYRMNIGLLLIALTTGAALYYYRKKPPIILNQNKSWIGANTPSDSKELLIDVFEISVNDLLEEDTGYIYQTLRRKINRDDAIVLHDAKFLKESLPLLNKMVNPGYLMAVDGQNMIKEGRKKIKKGRKKDVGHLVSEGTRLVSEGTRLVDEAVHTTPEVFALLRSQTNLSQKTPLHDIDFDAGLVELFDKLCKIDRKNLIRLFSVPDVDKKTCILSKNNYEKYIRIIRRNESGKLRFFNRASTEIILQMYRQRLAGRDPKEQVFVDKETKKVKFPEQNKFRKKVHKWMAIFDLNKCVSAFLTRNDEGSTVLHDPNRFNEAAEHIIKIGKVDIDVFFDIIGATDQRGQTPLHLARFSSKLIEYFDFIADTDLKKMIAIFEKQEDANQNCLENLKKMLGIFKQKDHANRTCLVNRIGVSNFELVAGIFTKISEMLLRAEQLEKRAEHSAQRNKHVIELSHSLIKMLRATYLHLQADILLHSLPLLQNLMKFKNSKVRNEAAELFSSALSFIVENERNVRLALEMGVEKSNIDLRVSAIVFDRIVNSVSFIGLVNSILDDKDIENGLKLSLKNVQETIVRLKEKSIINHVEELKDRLFIEFRNLVLNDGQIKTKLENSRLSHENVEEILKDSFTEILTKEEILTHLNQESTRKDVERRLKENLVNKLEQSALFYRFLESILSDEQVKSKLLDSKLNDKDVEEKLKEKFTKILQKNKIRKRLNQDGVKKDVEKKLKASLLKRLERSETLTPLNPTPQNLQIGDDPSSMPQTNPLTLLASN